MASVDLFECELHLLYYWENVGASIIGCVFYSSGKSHGREECKLWEILKKDDMCWGTFWIYIKTLMHPLTHLSVVHYGDSFSNLFS